MHILFLGMYFSQSRGTTPVIERVSSYLSVDRDFTINISSTKKNKFLRLFDLIKSVLVFNGDLIFIDVFSGNSFYSALLCNFLAKIRGITTIGILRGGKLPEFSSHAPSLTRCLLDNFDDILSPSKFLCDHYDSWNYSIRYLPNPINLEHFPYLARAEIDTQKEIRLLWVRAFASIYNPMIPIRILSILREIYPNVHLTMIGPDLGLLSTVKSLANQLKVNNHVSFIGPVSNTDLFRFFNQHDIFLNTTSYESFGMSVLEAASCGIPIVSTSVGEIPLLWDANREILLVDQISPASFVLQIRRLIESYSLLTYLTQNARAKAQRFDWNIIKSSWIDILQQHGFSN